MLAAKDRYIDEASKTIFQLSAEEQIRKRCLDRDEYYLDLRANERTIAGQKVTIAEQSAALADKNAIIQRLLAENASLKASAGKRVNSLHLCSAGIIIKPDKIKKTETPHAPTLRKYVMRVCEVSAPKNASMFFQNRIYIKNIICPPYRIINPR